MPSQVYYHTVHSFILPTIISNSCRPHTYILVRHRTVILSFVWIGPDRYRRSVPLIRKCEYYTIHAGLGHSKSNA
jgi:hypothetical protein